MKVYIIQRKGVYYQGVLGVFTKLGKCLNEAVKASMYEPDDHHTILVGEIELDILIAINRQNDFEGGGYGLQCTEKYTNELKNIFMIERYEGIRGTKEYPKLPVIISIQKL